MAFPNVIDAKGITFLKREEGFRAVPYKDKNSAATGYGHGIKPEEEYLYKTTLTEVQATQLLLKDILGFEAELRKVFKVKVTQNQWSCLVSLIFNIGLTRIIKAGLPMLVNTGKIQEAAALIRTLNKGYPELNPRRNREADLFLQVA